MRLTQNQTAHSSRAYKSTTQAATHKQMTGKGQHTSEYDPPHMHALRMPTATTPQVNSSTHVLHFPLGHAGRQADKQATTAKHSNPQQVHQNGHDHKRGTCCPSSRNLKDFGTREATKSSVWYAIAPPNIKQADQEPPAPTQPPPNSQLCPGRARPPQQNMPCMCQSLHVALGRKAFRRHKHIWPTLAATAARADSRTE